MAKLRPRHRYVRWWDDERSEGGSLIVTLAPGRAFVPHESERYAEHVRGFDTVREAMDAVRSASPCSCEYCRGTSA